MFQITNQVITACENVTEKKYVTMQEFREVIAYSEFFISAGAYYSNRIHRDLYPGEIGILFDHIIIIQD